MITIDNTKVSGSSDLTNFPILFSHTADWLKTVGNGGHVRHSSGYDIVFYNSAGTVQLDHEIEKYNDETGEFIAWVRIPTLEYDEDTEIRMYYGNSSVSSTTENVTGVWNSNYLMVHHLKESSGTLNDSTGSNDSDVENGMTYQSTGKIGDCLYFDEVDDYYRIPDFDYGDTFTISFWLKVPSNTGNLFKFVCCHACRITGGAQSNVRIYINEDGYEGPDDLQVRWEDVSNNDEALRADVSDGDINVTDGDWHYATAVRVRNGTNRLYLDGIEQDTEAANDTDLDPDEPIYIGRTADGNSGRYYGGYLDELRILDTNLSEDWIKTEYNNQNSPSTFYTLGSELGTASNTSTTTTTTTMTTTTTTSPPP